MVNFLINKKIEDKDIFIQLLIPIMGIYALHGRKFSLNSHFLYI
jgi:hypothetical protein